ncbi:MAG: single-stranded DNA-binding protein [Deltaproteobacteria bacterium]|nr:MAG: single-stranded DNA-binding protein [Deltaproteobacteria bacterium]
MLNRATLIGRLGSDPEVHYTQSGETFTRFTLATNQWWKDKEGNVQETTEWHRIVAWGKIAEICGEHLSKGKLIYVEGPIKTRKWDDEQGNSHYSTEIVLRSLKILDRKNQNTRSEASIQYETDELPF